VKERTTILLDSDLKEELKEKLGINNISAFVEDKLKEEVEKAKKKEKILKLNYGLFLNICAGALLFIIIAGLIYSNIFWIFLAGITAVGILIMNAVKEVLSC